MRRLLIAVLLAVVPSVTWAGFIFDGTNDNINWGNVTFSDGAALSCSAWAYNDNVTQDHFIMGDTNGTNGVFWIVDDTAPSTRTDTYRINITESAGAGGSAANIDSATGAAVATTWQHIAFTFTAASATGLKLYVSGTEDANSPADTTDLADAGQSASSWTAGTHPSNTFDRAGRLAELACWTRVLSTGEITALSKGMSPAILTFGLVFYAPLLGHQHDWVSGTTGTLANQAAATNSHPGIFYAQGMYPNDYAGAATILPGCLYGGSLACRGLMSERRPAREEPLAAFRRRLATRGVR